MSDGIIIQARSGSTRLKKKVLLPFYNGKGILEIILERIVAAYPDHRIVLATTSLPVDDPVAELATRTGVSCFRGAELDVLARFTGAAEQFGVRRLIRVCADNPFLQVDSFRELFEQHTRTPVDYVSYQLASGRPVILSHLGLFPELVTADALQRVAELTEDLLYREHVTNYLYTHREEFRVKFLPLPEYLGEREDIRFTLDTPEDFAMLQEIFGYWMEMGQPALPEWIRWLDGQGGYTERMKKIIAENQK